MTQVISFPQKLIWFIFSFALFSPLEGKPVEEGRAHLLLKPKQEFSEAALKALMRAHRVSEVDEVPALKVKVISVPKKAAPKIMAALNRAKGVEYCEPDHMAFAIGTANDPYFTSGQQWHLAKIEAPAAWETQTGSSLTKVAVLDTGVNASHPELLGKVLPGYDFINNDGDPTDDNGHGTAVSGCITANSNNSEGIAGLAWDGRIMSVKVLSSTGSGSYSTIANGLIFAVDNGSDVINMSLGGSSSSRTLRNAVRYAREKGCILIAAAGNEGTSRASYPAVYDEVVAVAATDVNDIRPTWSNYGSHIDLAAPGVSVLTLYGTNSYSYVNGTSFSSPVVAGVVSLMRSQAPAAEAQTIIDALVSSCDDVGVAGFDVYYGNGRVNARKALEFLSVSPPEDTTLPVVDIISPASGTEVSGLVNIEISASDESGIATLDLFVDGELLVSDPGSSVIFELDTTNYPNGSLAIVVQAKDFSGNASSDSIMLSVNNTLPSTDEIAPVCRITSPSDEARIRNRVKIRTLNSDNVGITRVELIVDGQLVQTKFETNPTFIWSTRKIARGAHTLQIIAYDVAGNFGFSQVITVYK